MPQILGSWEIVVGVIHIIFSMGSRIGKFIISLFCEMAFVKLSRFFGIGSDNAIPFIRAPLVKLE